MHEILVVEDNPKDEELILYALEKAGYMNQIKVVRDGNEALDYIFCKGLYTHRGHDNPIVILLDMHLPKVTGLKVLKKIRSNPETSSIPIVVLTVAEDEKIMMGSIALGVNSYLRKPVSVVQLSEAIQYAGVPKTAKPSSKRLSFENTYLSQVEPGLMHTLKKLIEISVNDALKTLSLIADAPFQSMILGITVLQADQLTDELRQRIKSESSRIKSVSLDFVGTLSGTIAFIFSHESTSDIAKAVSKSQGDIDFDERYNIDILSEIGNILVNRIVASIGRLLEKHFDISTPLYVGSSQTGIIVEDESDETVMIIAHTCLKIGDKYVDNDITISLRKEYFEILLEVIDSKGAGFLA